MEQLRTDPIADQLASGHQQRREVVAIRRTPDLRRVGALRRFSTRPPSLVRRRLTLRLFHPLQVNSSPITHHLEMHDHFFLQKSVMKDWRMSGRRDSNPRPLRPGSFFEGSTGPEIILDNLGVFGLFGGVKTKLIHDLLGTFPITRIVILQGGGDVDVT